MRLFKLGHAVVLALVLTGCGLNPVADRPAPNTAEESLAYAYATITSVSETTTDALQRQAISADTASEILAQLDRADRIADQAAVLLTESDDESAEKRLQIAQNLLLRLENRLAQEMNNGQ